MAVTPQDILEVTVAHDNGTAGEQLNRFQFRFDAGAPVSDADVMDDIEIIIQTLYVLVQAIISVRNVFREVKVFNVTQDRLMGSTDAGTYTGGSAADPAMPRGNAMYLHYVTSVPRVILSKYLPSMSQTQIASGGVLGAGTVTAITAFGVELALVQVLGGNTYAYGYLSPKTLSFVTPDVLVVKDVVAYQRRRKAGSGS